MDPLHLGSNEFVLTKEIVRYNDLNKKYRKLATSAKNNFINRYQTIFINQDTFEKDLNRIHIDYIRDACDFSVGDFIENSIYHIDTFYLIEAYKKSEFFVSVPTPFVEYQIIQNRFLEKIQGISGPLVGGGFGIEGAAEGIATATAANVTIEAVTGAIASLANSAKNKERIAALKEFIFSDKTKESLARLVFESTFNLHHCVAQEIETSTNSNIYHTYTRKDIQKSQGIINNINKGKIPKELTEHCIFSALELNPYSEQAYSTALRLKAFPETDIIELANFFGIKITPEQRKLISPTQPEFVPLRQAPERIREDFTAIVKSYKMDDYFTIGDIPEKKLESALKNYFHSNFETDANESTIIKSPPGEIIALVDFTVLGSAENGLAIGVNGIYWKDGKSAQALSWHDIARRGLSIESTFLGLRIGDVQIYTSGCSASKPLLVKVLDSLLQHYRTTLSPT